ncbi:transcriptional regulator [Nonomuraea longicatena]|uniref:XRE family transcriptional regulator n=1 Tax=Nonomuraea longicatena TaxID=83682 RepID=A0ABP4BRI1_9ACTN
MAEENPREVPLWAERLREERRKRAWPQKKLVAQLFKAAGQDVALPMPESVLRRIKDHEAGRNLPKDPYPILYCRVYGLSERDLFLDSAPESRRSPDEILATLLPQPGEPLAARFTHRNRRRVGASTVNDLSARVHGLRLADDVLSGDDLIGPAFRELDDVVHLYRDSTHSDDVGRALLVIIGEYAQIAGWIASDAAQHDLAARTYRLGIEAAREAGDEVLESNLTGSLAYQIANVGDPAEGVALARAALHVLGPHAPGRARALAWDRVAWAHVRTGDGPATMRALGEAGSALAGDRGNGNPAYLYWVNAGELQVMEARAYTELRRPLRAIPLLVDVLNRYDTTHTREFSLYLSWLAVALADANEPEEAVRAARRMLDLSADVASKRAAHRTRVVLKRLAQYRDVPPVQELLNEYRYSA